MLLDLSKQLKAGAEEAGKGRASFAKAARLRATARLAALAVFPLAHALRPPSHGTVFSRLQLDIQRIAGTSAVRR